MTSRPADAAAPARPARRLALPALRPDWKVLLPLAGATLLLLSSAFFGWQAWLVLREDDTRVRLERYRIERSAALVRLVGQTQACVQEAAAAPDVIAALGGDDTASVDREAAIAAFRKALPGALDVELYGAGMNEVIASDLRKFGYAKAAQLLKAMNAGSAPIQSLPGKGQRVLSIVETVKAGDRVLAYVWAALPMTPLTESFHKAELSGGRLELRQGPGGENDLVVDLVGDKEAAMRRGDAGRQIEGSNFRVVALQPDLFIVGPHHFLLLLALAGIGLIGGLGLLWLRHVGIEAGLRALHLLHGLTEDHSTLAEAMKKMPVPPPAARTTSSLASRTTTGAAAPAAKTPAAPARPVSIDRSIFRAYDIRGVVGSTLTTEVARLIGRAIGSEVIERGLREIVVGRDGRLSGPELSAALIEGLRAAGCDVIDVGQVPTPVVYFATYHLNTGSGVAVTGSHNPPDYNGFKIVVGGETLAESAIQELFARISENRFTEGNGGLQVIDVKQDYIERISGDIQIDRRLRVVVDCGNGVPGAIAPTVLQDIGCEVLPLYCEVDGTFPNHHPDPSDLHNLQDLILTVKRMDADLGLAFDGDGDRLGVVTKAGEVIFPDRLLMLFAIDVLSRNPGASIIYDVKCTGHLQPMILKHGGSPIMWKTGHSLIKAKMRETDAELAGEMSGHFFFRERWYGFDDGIYAAARLMEILAGDLDGRDAGAIFAELPKGVSTPELKIAMAEGEHYRFIERFKERASFEGARVTTIDGVRADWSDGWGLVRASNTTPVLVLRFDADNEAALRRIQDVYRKQLLALDPALKLPF